MSFANELLDKADIEPDVHELVNQKVYSEWCKGSTICAVYFLPNIYESNAKERKTYLEMIKKAAKANRNYRLTHFWLQAGDQLDLERQLNLGFGFPALVVVSPTKSMFGMLQGSFSEAGIKDYLRMAGGGQVRNLSALPTTGFKVKKTDKWDGKDAPVIEEEPLDDDYENEEL